jgi:hypothetical protein
MSKTSLLKTKELGVVLKELTEIVSPFPKAARTILRNIFDLSYVHKLGNDDLCYLQFEKLNSILDFDTAVCYAGRVSQLAILNMKDDGEIIKKPTLKKRLVGVELNPGPKPRGLSKAIGLAGIAIAKMASRRKRKGAKPRRGAGRLRNSTSATSISAPSSMGVVGRGQSSSKPFSVPFSSSLLQVMTSTTGPYLSRVGLAVATTFNSANVGLTPYQSADNNLIPWCFPPVINNLALSFSQYRIKPGTARMFYRGAVPTSTAGALAISVETADQPFLSTPQFTVVSSNECAITTPCWAASVEFDRSRLHSILYTDNDSGWKYTNAQGVISDPESRQVFLANMSCAGFGLPTNTILGTIFLEGELEFKHITPIVAEYNAPFVLSDHLPIRSRVFPSLTCAAASSSTTPSSSLPNEVPYMVADAEPAADLSQSVHLSSDFLSRIGLKKV